MPYKNPKDRYVHRGFIRFSNIRRLGGHCEICGCQNHEVLEFHHCNGRRKEYGLNAEDIRQELDEGIPMILLCANCHVQLHRNKRRREVK